VPPKRFCLPLALRAPIVEALEGHLDVLVVVGIHYRRRDARRRWSPSTGGRWRASCRPLRRPR
jgi:hypothetical protein